MGRDGGIRQDPDLAVRSFIAQWFCNSGSSSILGELLLVTEAIHETLLAGGRATICTMHGQAQRSSSDDSKSRIFYFLPGQWGCQEHSTTKYTK